MKSPYKEQALPALLILLFTYTAVSKLLDLDTFQTLMAIQPFSKPMVQVLVWAIPLSELAATVLLAFPATRLIGLYVSLVILSAFTIYTLLVLSGFYARPPCPCGGIVSNMSWTQHLVFNLACILIAVVAIIQQHNTTVRTKRKYIAIRRSRIPVENSRQSSVK